MEEAWLHPGKSFQEAFPRLFKTRTTSFQTDFLDPAGCLRHLLNWLWLQTRLGRPDVQVAFMAREILLRTFEAYTAPMGQKWRSSHDLLLLSAAIVLGDRAIIQRAAEAATFADLSSDNPFTAASCGVLKARLLGDHDLEAAQLALRSACKGGPVPDQPLARAGYRALVERKPKLLLSQSRKAAETYWSALERERFPDVIQRTGGVRLANWSSMTYWPWPELTLLKLSIPADDLPDTDPFWLPHELLGRWTGNATVAGLPGSRTAAKSSVSKSAP